MITGLTEYIEDALSSAEYDDILLKFQRRLLEEGKEAEMRLRYAGLNDEKIMLDLFKSQHRELTAEYRVFRKDEIKKRRESAMHRFMLKGTPVYFLAMTAVYLSASFLTDNWAQSWLIIIGFVTVWVDTVGILMTAEIATKRRIFHPLARVLLAFSVMMTSVCAYLIGLILFRAPNMWVAIPAGVFMMLCTDALFVKATDQKLRIINYLIYIPFAGAMAYVVLGGAHIIPWDPGWSIVPFSAAVDILIIVAKLIDNRKYIYRPEE